MHTYLRHKERRKILTGKENLEFNGHYKIESKIITWTGFNVVLGVYEQAMNGYQYVTWTENSRGYDRGHYFANKQDAIIDMFERGVDTLGVNLHEKYRDDLAIEDITVGLREFLSEDEIEHIVQNQDFMSAAYHRYWKIDFSIINEGIVDMLEELYNEFESPSLSEEYEI